MSTELTPVEVGEVVLALSESEAKIKQLVKYANRIQKKAVEGMEFARNEAERCNAQIGSELYAIKTSRSFREDDRYRSFTAFMDDAPRNLGLSTQRAWQLHKAYEPAALTTENVRAEPENPRQRYELARVPLVQQPAVIEATIAAEGKLTARGIRETHERIEAGETPEQIIQPTGRDLLVAWAAEFWEGDTAIAAYDGTTIGQVKAWVREVVR